MAPGDTQTNVRIPRKLKERLEASAAAEGRSLSSEFSVRLSFAYEAEDLVKQAHAEIDSLLAMSKDLRAMLEEARAEANSARAAHAKAEAKIIHLEEELASWRVRAEAPSTDDKELRLLRQLAESASQMAKKEAWAAEVFAISLLNYGDRLRAFLAALKTNRVDAQVSRARGELVKTLATAVHYLKTSGWSEERVQTALPHARLQDLVDEASRASQAENQAFDLLSPESVLAHVDTFNTILDTPTSASVNEVSDPPPGSGSTVSRRQALRGRLPK